MPAANARTTAFCARSSASASLRQKERAYRKISARCSTTTSRRSKTSSRSGSARHIGAPPPWISARPPRVGVPYIPDIAPGNGPMATGLRSPARRRSGGVADARDDEAESTVGVSRVLVTRQLPEGGLDPLVAAGHELVQRDGDEP